MVQEPNPSIDVNNLDVHSRSMVEGKGADDGRLVRVSRDGGGSDGEGREGHGGCLKEGRRRLDWGKDGFLSTDTSELGVWN